MKAFSFISHGYQQLIYDLCYRHANIKVYCNNSLPNTILFPPREDLNIH